MQRWGSEEAPVSAVLLRTGALMSLASLGTAGLVLCGALAVGGPSGADFVGALGDGPSSVEAGEPERTTAVAAPSGRRSSPRSDAPRRNRPAAPLEAPRTPVVTVVGGGGTAALSGTDTYAASTPTDLDSVTHPARGLAVPSPSASPAVVPSPIAAAPPRTVSAVRSAPAETASPADSVEPAAPVQARVQAPKAQAPKAQAPKAQAPKAQAPKAQAPKAQAPKAQAPKAQAPKAQAPKAQAPKAQAPKAQAARAAPPAPAIQQPAPAAQPGNGGNQDHPKGEPPGQAKDKDKDKGGNGNGNGKEH